MYYYRQGGTWQKGSPRRQTDGQFQTASSGGSTASAGGSGGGFDWDQTHADTSWVTDADANDNLNVEVVSELSADAFMNAVDAGGSTPTLVVFEVGGVIDCGGDFLRPSTDNVYIAGQTAPYPGITFIRGGLRPECDNFIMEHVSIFCGNDTDSPGSMSALGIDDGNQDHLYNHCTFAWGTDETVTFYDNADNCAVINSINAEALNDSDHPEAPHGYALLLKPGTGTHTYAGNLHPHNWARNPRPNDGSLWMVNNYFWNWGKRIVHGSDDDLELDMIGNVIESGPDTNADKGIFDSNPGTVYAESNDLIPDDTPLGDDEIDYVDSPMNKPAGISESELFAPSELESVLAGSAGPRPANRSPHEKRIVEDFVARDGGIIDNESDVGGYPDYSSQTRSLSAPDSGVLNWLSQYTDQVTVA